ncbi:GerMN domain-containing protein [Agromyces sp. Soil535]|uniref:GerMN domain-containing protein n=1 Tax=Agromyces sp. Soil535 TaxID=1736390 RepID=UPI0009E94F94|nr:GerMN domain-containing protein [Agromyces sp. Soil535]
MAITGCVPGGDGETSSPPVQTSPASPTTSPSPTPRAAPLTLYYVVLGDGGASGEPLGCGDSLVAFETEPVSTDDPLRAGMERLLADPERELGASGLYSAIPGGTLEYLSGGVDGTGTVTVELTGRPAPAGVCDNPRIESQLERTAMAAAGASAAVILVDSVPIEEVLSLQ